MRALLRLMLKHIDAPRVILVLYFVGLNASFLLLDEPGWRGWVYWWTYGFFMWLGFMFLLMKLHFRIGAKK